MCLCLTAVRGNNKHIIKVKNKKKKKEEKKYLTKSTETPLF